MDKKIKELLYQSFDKKLKRREQEALDKALAGSSALQKEKGQVEKLRRSLAKGKEASFNPNFADQVMSAVRDLRTENGRYEFYDNIYFLFRPMAIAATIIIIAMVSLNIAKTDQVSLKSAIVVPEITICDAYDPVVALNLE